MVKTWFRCFRLAMLGTALLGTHALLLGQVRKSAATAKPTAQPKTPRSVLTESELLGCWVEEVQQIRRGERFVVLISKPTAGGDGSLSVLMYGQETPVPGNLSKGEFVFAMSGKENSTYGDSDTLHTITRSAAGSLALRIQNAPGGNGMPSIFRGSIRKLSADEYSLEQRFLRFHSDNPDVVEGDLRFGGSARAPTYTLVSGGRQYTLDLEKAKKECGNFLTGGFAEGRVRIKGKISGSTITAGRMTCIDNAMDLRGPSR